ncbi:TPA: hypothetical protein RUZ85_003382 [Vibrio cholerae]|uniref:hypothetical protein n=2 Tax=Vibrio cholerae TaxID=666 RepID=UPI001E2D3306|nr:hypothetical protein [Vibrio cholerae]EGR2027050.1 hypothetical protein [Vibrio cholerae]BER96693.1 hypothetical protein VNVC001_30140 [Vibrio cholerae]HDZ9485564.1 hypothetical protein [Vibrio cholerae]
MHSGPLSNHMSYLQHIALDNFSDYNFFIEELNEKESITIKDKYKRLRLFLNTIESLNNIPEYFFHDVKKLQGWKDNDQRNVIGKIRDKNPILKDIEQIANAYKHRYRYKNGDLQSDDMQTSLISLSINLNEEKVIVNVDFDSIADEEIMNDAWKFWLDYYKKADISILLPNI